ncbi:MAG: cytochrome P450 [Quisquiliibacterium sp.]
MTGGGGQAKRTPRELAGSFELAAVPDGFYEDPYPYFAALTEHEPVRVLRDGSLLLTGYADVLAMYRNPVASSDKKIEFKPKFGDSPLYEHHTTSLVFSDPPRHTRVRRLLMGAVNQRAISRMEQGVIELVDRLLDEMADARRVDLIESFASRIPVEVIGNMLAIPHAERGPLRGWSLAILGALEPVPSAPVLAQGNQAVSEFKSYLQGLVADRRAAPLDPELDMLSRLLLGETDGERLSEDELIQNCIFLLNAGHETTANLIGNGIELLMRFPDEQRRLRSDPALLASAVEEMLRFESPIQLNNRRLLQDSEIGGRQYPAGTLINILMAAANRDPAQFPDPQRFDVGRRPNRHLAFGQGDHACVGMNVARMEGRIAVGRLLTRFGRIEPDGEPVRDRRVRFRGFTRLPILLA